MAYGSKAPLKGMGYEKKSKKKAYIIDVYFTDQTRSGPKVVFAYSRKQAYKKAWGWASGTYGRKDIADIVLKEAATLPENIDVVSP